MSKITVFKFIHTIVILLIPLVGFASDNPLLLDCLHLSSSNSIPKEMRELLETTQYSQRAQGLIADIKRQFGSLTLELVSDESIPGRGCIIRDDKIIQIRESLMLDPLNFSGTLLWEMCNADNDSLKLPKMFSIDKAGYAFFTEAAEHLSLVRSTQILIDYLESISAIPTIKVPLEEACSSTIKDIIEEHQTDPELTFSNYWAAVNNPETGFNTIHADLYRGHFDQHQVEYSNYQKGHSKSNKECDKEIQELIKYAFSPWKIDEEIPHFPKEARIYYSKLLK